MRGNLPDARDHLKRYLVQAADEGKESARIYAAVLLDPGSQIGVAAAGSKWTFPLALILIYSILAPLLLYVGWPASAEKLGLNDVIAGRRVNIPAVFLAAMVFFSTLTGVTFGCVRLLARRRPGLLGVLNCVAVALVPFSALTVAAWIVLYLYPPLSLLIVIFGALAATGCFAEALRSQFDLKHTSRLYAVPLMIVVALLVAVLFLMILFGR